jgi:hypothetical protein
MAQKLLRRLKKSDGVRQSRVQLKRGFIHPLGMNRKHKRFSKRFKNMDSQTTNLSSRRIENEQQLGAKLRRLPR